jgi:hypothetical protein
VSARCKEVFHAFLHEVSPLVIVPASSSFAEFMQHSVCGVPGPESRVVPPRFFGLSVEDKIAILRNLIEADSPAAALFIAQFVVNELLRRKSKENDDTGFAEILGSINCKSALEIPKVFDDLQKRLAAVQTEKQDVETKYAKLERAFIERSRRMSEQISGIQRLRLQNRDLQSHVAVLELNLQTNEAVMASVRFQAPSEGDFAVAELESENKKLLFELEQAQQTAERAARKLARAKEQLADVSQTFETENELLKQRLKDQKKKEKHKIQALASQFQQELQASTTQLEESKHCFETNFERLKTRMQESRGISSDRIHALEETEQKCQVLTSENARLQMLGRTGNMKIAALEEQLAKERRLTQVQIAAQRLAFESQLHELAARTHSSQIEAQEKGGLRSESPSELHRSGTRPWPLVNAIG